MVLLAACATQPAAPSKSAAEPVLTRGTAVITGRIDYAGAPRKAAAINMDSVPACARQHAKPALDDSVIIAPDGDLANVYVWVKSGLPNTQWPAPNGNARIDQVGCIYLPHVVAIQAGQGVEFTNHDPTNHNIHPVPQLNAEVNRIQAPQGEPLLERFPLPEVGILIKCNVHPWMRAWVHVAPHPYFSLTGTDGAFKISNLPPGNYVLEAWHEKLGRLEMKVAVSEGETSAANFTYR
jgi:plastocyanin